MKTTTLFKAAALTTGIVLFFTACTNDFNKSSKPVIEPVISEELKNFSFATRGEVTLSIDYAAPGYKAIVEVYAENPLMEDTKTLKEGITPIYAGYTDNNGKLDRKINIPTAVTTAYLYTTTWGLPRLVTLETTKAGLSYDATKQSAAPAGKSTRAQYDYVTGDKSPYTLRSRTDNLMALGLFDIGAHMIFSNLGEASDYTPGYVSQTTTIKEESVASLAQRSQQYFTKYDGHRADLLKPAEVTNIKMKKSGSLDLVYLTENAEFFNTFGYYYYQAGAAPTEAEFKTMKKYMVIPSVDEPATIKNGDTFSLKYFGTDGTAEASNIFPANTVIGWFIVSNGWNKTNGKIRNWSSIDRNFFFSNDTDKNMRFVALQDSKTGVVVLGCEDEPEKLFDRTTEDYCDLLFFVKSTDGELDNTGKPDIGEETPETPEGSYTIAGTLAFEDIWPTGGDYDMNDVALSQSRKITFDANNKATSIEESFEFVQRPGAASIDSYFAYQMVNMGRVELPTGCQIEAATGSIIYTSETKLSSGNKFVVKRTFNGSIDQEELAKDFNPYIIVGKHTNNRREVHLPGKQATSMADKSLIGTADDAYYMNKEGNYPFAIDIPKSDFSLSREARAIDKTYPRFATWASSFGKNDADWYIDAPQQ